MATGLDAEGQGVVHGGTDGADFLRPFGQGGVGVQLGQGFRHRLQRLGQTRHLAPPGLEGFGFDGQGAVTGLADPGVKLRQFDGGETDLVGQGLAVNEGAVGTGAQQPFRRLGGRLQEIAQDGVVLDLERHAGFGDGAGLQIGDHAAAVVAQGAGGVQFGTIVGPDEAAVAGQMRRLLHQTVDQIGHQARQVGRQAETVQRQGNAARLAGQRIDLAHEQAGDPLGDRQADARRRKIARAAAPQGQPPDRAGDIGGRLEVFAQVAAQIAPLQHPFDGVELFVDGQGIAQRPGDPFRQRPRAARGDGAVDAGQQRPFAFAPLGPVDLQTGAGRRVDGQEAAFAQTARRGQGRNLARLGRLQIGGDQA